VREADMWSTAAEAARYYARRLRLAPWDHLPSRLAVTCESDGLALALFGILSDTPLRIVAVRGNGSSSAVAELADWLAEAQDEATVLHVGDADGQGVAIEVDLRSRLALHSRRLGTVWPTVERVWLSVEQALAHGLPSRPAKLTPMDRKYGFTSECWEAEAGDPAIIATLIRDRIAELIDADVLATVAEREQTGRAAFVALAETLELSA